MIRRAAQFAPRRHPELATRLAHVATEEGSQSTPPLFFNTHPIYPKEAILAKPNYQYEKRQKDLAKKKKQEEKRQRKLDKSNVPPAETPNQPSSLEA